MVVKTSTEIITDLIAQLKVIQTNADTSTGQVLRDLVVDLVGNEMGKLYTEIDNLRQLSSLVYADTMTDDDMDNLAYNWSLVRGGSTSASGKVTFQTLTKPTTTITIPIGTVVRTTDVSGGSYSFTTTTQAVFNTATLLNSNTGYYEVDADIQADSEGSLYNVSANTITVITSTITGVDYVTNKIATAGGTDQETNSELARRILARVQGTNVGTSGGYRNAALLVDGVEDALAVGPNDSEMVRNTYGGSVDLYLLGQVLSTVTATTTYDGLTNITSFPYRPVTSVGTVTGITLSGGGSYTFVKDTDYEEHIDTSQVFGYSTRANDYLLWKSNGISPCVGSDISIVEVYDSAVADVQELLDSDVYNMVTSDVLVKAGKEVGVIISLVITKVSGYTSSDIETEVNDAITNALAEYGLGQKLQASDVVDLAYTVSGVDAVALPFTLFYRNDQAASNSLADIACAKTEYLRADTISVSVV